MLFKVNPKSLTTLLFYLLISFTFYSQTGTIRGTVYEKESGEPSFGTNVKIKGTGIGSSTDINGFYQINKLKPGKIVQKFQTLNLVPLSILLKLLQIKSSPTISSWRKKMKC